MENTIGLKIKTIRKSSRLTQNHLSCTLIDRTTLSKIENGHIFPSIPQLIHIAKVLNVSMNTLLCEENYSSNICISSMSKRLKDLYNKKKYHEIIDTITPYDFITTYYVGLSYYKLNLTKESKPLLLKCEKLFHLLNDGLKPLYAENLAIAIVTLRRVIINSFNCEENLNFLTKALNYLETYNLNNIKSYYAIVNNIGVYYLYTAKYSDAVNFYEKFLKVNVDTLPIPVVTLIHVNLSIAYFSTKNYDKSIEHVNKSIFFYNYVEDGIECAECHLNLFNAYLYKNEIEKASNVIKTVLNEFKSIDIINTFKACEIVLLYNLNRIDEILIKNKSINYGILKEASKVDYDFIMGHVYFKKSNYKAAINHYNKCINFLVENKRYMDAYMTYNALYLMSKNKDFKTKFLEYKKLHDADKYNHISTNITSPNYFLYNS